MHDFLKRLVFRKPAVTESEAEELRIAFQARYHSFKLLLNANNEALEIMADLDMAMRGIRPFGMTFVRARCTEIATQVWQMVKHLNDLSSGKYEALRGRFKSIQDRITPFFSHEKSVVEGKLALSLNEVNRDLASQVGGKTANLGEIRNRLGLKVPGGFVVTVDGYRRFMDHSDLQTEIDRLLQSAEAERLDHLFHLSNEIQQLIIRAEFPADLEEVILHHYRLMEEEKGEGVTVAVRSSALGEDFAGASFAGQYRSELNVSKEYLLKSYREIVASKYSLPAMTYRLNRGIRDEDVAMCVCFLCMVDAVAGGVVYSRNPVNVRDDSTLVHSAWGLPKPVVDGRTPADLFVIAQGTPPEIRHREIPDKEQKFVCYPDEGICRMDMTGEEGSRPSISDAQALELARLALQLEDYFAVPQDIEWAVGPSGAITVLQCRPLQQKEARDAMPEKEVDKAAAGPVLLQGGVTASPGTAAGPVFAVHKDMDALQFPDGAVLIAAQSLPRWAPLLGRAAAVVTDQGTLAGHLATVAREFGVPALFGVKGAVERLGKGQEVTVDADDCVVYEGRIEALVSRVAPPRSLMAGSPVFEALKGAARHISPLNLLDPDAPEFDPERCETLHDITRFCHEKAVDEMFRFGKDHHFPQRSSKQLHCDVPMQWWILNLDDGFKEEVTGRYVRLENITSIPMLALWEGITAIPWEGPPPMDGKGFMSVVFEATTNTALTPGVRSKYADRNYFMLSKNYCCLNSRLGAHFSIIEALVGERTRENYVSFQFRGGAADYDRRLKRVLFVTEILEEYGFRVEVNEDNLIARLEGREEDFMKERLRILGYLTLHTRQLDMVMASPPTVDHYRTKMHEDIGKILGKNTGTDT